MRPNWGYGGVIRSARMRVVLAVLTAASCRYSLDDAEFRDAPQARICAPSATNQGCIDAEARSDLTYIQATILKPRCTFRSCHDGGNQPAGALDLRTEDAARTNLVGVHSDLDASRTLVVPGNARQSFLLVLLGAYAPADMDPPLAEIPRDEQGRLVGTMPQGAPVLCCQKLDAVERWIIAGAP